MPQLLTHDQTAQIVLACAPYAERACASFGSICESLESTFRFCEPIEQHYNVFSDAYYDVIIRAAIEFEGLARSLFRAQTSKDSTWTKMSVLGEYRLDWLPTDSRILFQRRRSEAPTYFLPLDGWDQYPDGLKWFGAYTDLKHDRVANMEKATLRSSLASVADLFYLLVTMNAFGGFNTFSGRRPIEQRMSYHFWTGPFEIEVAADWSPPLFADAIPPAP